MQEMPALGRRQQVGRDPEKLLEGVMTLALWLHS